MRSPQPLLAAIALLGLCLTAPASAHRLDEYLIDTTFSVRAGRIEAEMRLTPGIKVADAVLSGIDADRNGVLSDAEWQAYARRVLDDVTLTVDGKALQPRLVSTAYPAVEDMREGVGEILLQFDALPGGSADRTRTLSFENRHRRECAAYMVNALTPTDPGVHLGTQSRTPDQSSYHLDFTQGTQARAGTATLAASSTLRLWLAVDAVALLGLAAISWRRRRGKCMRLENPSEGPLP